MVFKTVWCWFCYLIHFIFDYYSLFDLYLETNECHLKRKNWRCFLQADWHYSILGANYPVNSRAVVTWQLPTKRWHQLFEHFVLDVYSHPIKKFEEICARLFWLIAASEAPEASEVAAMMSTVCVPFFFSVWGSDKSQVTVSEFVPQKFASAHVCANRYNRKNKFPVRSFQTRLDCVVKPLCPKSAKKTNIEYSNQGTT